MTATAEMPRVGGMVGFTATGVAFCPECNWRGIATSIDGERSTFCPVHETDAQYAPDRKVGRNEPCPCGSGRKYKRCCKAA